LSILGLFDNWRTAPTDESLNAYLVQAEPFCVEAVTRSVQQFASGLVERDHRFPPPVPEFIANVRQWQRAIDSRHAASDGHLISYRAGEPRPAGYEPLGGTVDFGRGKITLAGLTEAEQMLVFKGNGVAPDGRSLAHMSASEIRHAIAQKDLAQVDGGKTFAVPKLGRMG
jgi:hypothetical protein